MRLSLRVARGALPLIVLAATTALAASAPIPSIPGPATPAASTQVLSASTSGATCAVRAGGTLACWGNDENGFLADGRSTTTPVPSPVAPLATADVTAVEMGSLHACALRSTGVPRCWGADWTGQLGDNPSTSGIWTNRPVDATQFAGATDIAALWGTTCFLDATHAVKCAGTNGHNELGTGIQDDGTHQVPVQVYGMTDAVALDGGEYYACAVRSNGTIGCWGTGYYNQLGQSDGSDGSFYPLTVEGITDAVDVATGNYHVCALRTTGAVACWGHNFNGQVGNDSTTDVDLPVPVQGITNAVRLAIAPGSTCALLRTGTVKCWGDNAYGQLGDGTQTERHTPVAVAGLTDATAISMGEDFACATRRTGNVVCWGRNPRGEVGLTPDPAGSNIVLAQNTVPALPDARWVDWLASPTPTTPVSTTPAATTPAATTPAATQPATTTPTTVAPGTITLRGRTVRLTSVLIAAAGAPCPVKAKVAATGSKATVRATLRPTSTPTGCRVSGRLRFAPAVRAPKTVKVKIRTTGLATITRTAARTK